LPPVSDRQRRRLVQADKSACNSARQVFARPPFRSFDRIANAYRSSPTIPPAAPTPKAISLTAFKDAMRRTKDAAVFLHSSSSIVM
jgi:hypothetical protein